MLQWMGGSRRKVTTSRKSTQKRQKQYFEQRRRQLQQQTAGLGSFEEGINIQGLNHKEHRSLDVLSLRNLSTVPQDCKPSSHDEREDPKVIGSTVKDHITKDPLVILANTVAPPDSLETTEARTLAGCQAETISQKKVPFSYPDDNKDTFNGIHDELDLWKTTTKQRSSIFYLLGDDGRNGNLEVSLVPEAHVAFSVEGLGKVGEETPPHSPQRLDRCVSYGFSSPLKASRRLNSSKNLNYLLDELEFGVDGIMPDIDVPLSGSSLKFSMGFKDPYRKLKKDLSAVVGHVQYRGNGSKIGSTFGDRKTFIKADNYKEDIWDVRSDLLDTNFLDEMESDMSWKSLPCQMDGNSTNFLDYRDNEMLDFAFEAPHVLKDRDSIKATEGFRNLELLALKYQTSENYYDFVNAEGERHHSIRGKFEFSDATCQADRSCFVTEDVRDNLSLLSEESCSSTAVRGAATNISLSSFKARHNRRDQNASTGPEINCSADTVFLKERHLKNRNGIWKGNNVGGSGKCHKMPTLIETKSACHLNCSFQGKIGPYGSWLFEEGYRSADMNSGFDSAYRTSETKISSSHPKTWTENYSGAFPVPETHIAAKLSCYRSKHDSSVKCSPCRSLVAEKFAFCQPSSHIHSHDSSIFSKLEFGSTKPGFLPVFSDFELEGKPLDSSQGEKLNPDLSAHQAVSKAEKERSKFQENGPEENMNMGALGFEEHGPESKEEKDGTLERSSSVKMPDKSESRVDEKENEK